MAWIRDDAGDEATKLFKGMADPAHGQVDNILRVHALHPEGLRAHFSLYQSVMAGTDSLPKADREMIALRVSQLNHCRY